MALSFLKKKNPESDSSEKLPDQPHDSYQSEGDESNWLVSYADMMTLLCAFFIMMFSMSTLQTPKFEKAREEVSKHFGGGYDKPNAQLSKVVQDSIASAQLGKEVTVRSNPAGVSISFESTLFFDSLGAAVKSDGQKVLTELARSVLRYAKDHQMKYKIVVEGHTDAQPILSGTFLSNWELSGARASRVVDIFLAQGFQPADFMPVGYGSTRPREPSRDSNGNWIPENLAKNRRVVLRILDSQENSIPWNMDLDLAIDPPPESAKSAAIALPPPSH